MDFLPFPASSIESSSAPFPIQPPTPVPLGSRLWGVSHIFFVEHSSCSSLAPLLSRVSSSLVDRDRESVLVGVTNVILEDMAKR